MYNEANGSIEMHSHTAYSDGAYGEDEHVKNLYELKRENRLSLEVVFVTDHDTMDAYEPVCRANVRVANLYATQGLEPIQFELGVELTTHMLDREVHILGYFGSQPKIAAIEAHVRPLALEVVSWSEDDVCSVDGYERVLNEHFATLGIKRRLDFNGVEEQTRTLLGFARSEQIAKKQHEGDKLTWGSRPVRRYVRKAISDTVGVPELATQVFTAREHAADRYVAALAEYSIRQEPHTDAEFVRARCPKLVGILRSRTESGLSPVDAPLAVRAIRTAGGLPVLAHPAEDVLKGVSGHEDSPEARVGFDALVELKKAGLWGVEIYTPTSVGKDELVARLLAFCRDNELVPTGGADWHGKPGQENRLARFSPSSALYELRKAL